MDNRRWWKIIKTTNGGQTLVGISNSSSNSINKYALSQNYPNPFNPVTKIKYDIPFDGKVSIKIFDISGRLINTLVNEYKVAGRFETDFHGENLSSGVYYYRIESGEFSQVRKMILIK
ncbi:MAG: T9SS type A sorting domain-containing protein [Ignavibacteriae bacterium]|nr:T9SS type A sorting domain-containing protein [Ignavibacteriota bacterium]